MNPATLASTLFETARYRLIAWKRSSRGQPSAIVAMLAAAVAMLHLLWPSISTGMESEALWALDREGGVEKAFCCISARARDFARFGLLYLKGGSWNGEQLVPSSWIARSVLPGVCMRESSVSLADVPRRFCGAPARGARRGARPPRHAADRIALTADDQQSVTDKEQP